MSAKGQFGPADEVIMISARVPEPDTIALATARVLVAVEIFQRDMRVLAVAHALNEAIRRTEVDVEYPTTVPRIP